MKPKPILLVEDDPKDIELTRMALQEAGLPNEVIILDDGQQALDFLRRDGAFKDRKASAPAVVLLDIKLPKLDGFEVLRQIKGDPALAKTPVVMLTSSREEADLVSGYGLGVNAYVVKPFGWEALSITLRGLVRFWAILNQTPDGMEAE